MTWDARRWGEVACCVSVIWASSVVSVLMFIFPRCDVYVLDDPVSWFKIILQTFLLPTLLTISTLSWPGLINLGKHSTTIFITRTSDMTTTVAHPFLVVMMHLGKSDPISLSGRCCSWPHTAHSASLWPVCCAASPRCEEPAPATLGRAPSVACGASVATQSCVDTQTADMWPMKLREKIDQSIIVGQVKW